jgi:2-polyprenyl-3-methyl-5-hydroxy-6-metoxy-1,4-benzoquinol methylase
MNIICPICSNNNFKKLLSIYYPDRFEIAVGIAANDYERFWYECLRCGVAINYHKKENLQKLESLSENYYEVDFGKINLFDRYNSIMKLPDHRSDNKGRVSRIKNFINNNRSFLNYNFNGDGVNKILDIGAGLGIFLSEFLDNKWEGYAIEPDPKALEHLYFLRSKIKNLTIYEGIYSGQNIYKDYNLITLNKVVEHVANPVYLLTSLHSALNKNSGLIYIEVPDKLSIFYKKSDDNILGSLHYNLYDPVSLSELFKISGFEPLLVGRVSEPSGKITTYGFAITLNK